MDIANYLGCAGNSLAFITSLCSCCMKIKKVTDDEEVKNERIIKIKPLDTLIVRLEELTKKPKHN